MALAKAEMQLLGPALGAVAVAAAVGTGGRALLPGKVASGFATQGYSVGPRAGEEVLKGLRNLATFAKGLLTRSPSVASTIHAANLEHLWQAVATQSVVNTAKVTQAASQVLPSLRSLAKAAVKFVGLQNLQSVAAVTAGAKLAQWIFKGNVKDPDGKRPQIVIHNHAPGIFDEQALLAMATGTLVTALYRA